MIREMEHKDLEEVLKLAVKMHEESDYGKRMSMCKKKTFRFGVDAVYRDDMNGWVYERDGKIVGFLIAHLNEFLFSDYLLASEECFYILPEYRGGLGAIRMINTFKRWALDQEAECIEVGCSTGIHPEKTGRFYEKVGFDEKVFLYRRFLM